MGQFAVQQQAGGPQSKEIAQWMVGVTEQYFYDNDTDAEEIAEYLATILDQELNTIVDDESDLQIGEFLCRMYQMCLAGKDSDVKEELMKMPKPDLSNCRLQDDTTSDREEENECPNLVSEQMKTLQLSDNSSGSSLLTAPEAERELTEEEKQQLQDEADGWTVIKKTNKI